MGKYLKSNNTVNHRGLWDIFKCIKNTEYYWGSSTPSFLGYSPINCSKYYHLLFLHKNIDIIQHGSEEVLCFLVNISYNLSSTQVTQRRKKDKNYKTTQISPTQSLELPFPQCLWSRDSSVRGSHPPRAHPSCSDEETEIQRWAICPHWHNQHAMGPTFELRPIWQKLFSLLRIFPQDRSQTWLCP